MRGCRIVYEFWTKASNMMVSLLVPRRWPYPRATLLLFMSGTDNSRWYRINSIRSHIIPDFEPSRIVACLISKVPHDANFSDFMSVKRKREETDKDGNAHFKSVKSRFFCGVSPMSWFLMRRNFGMSRCCLTSRVPRYKRLRQSRWANPELWRKVLSMEIFKSCRTSEWEEVWAKGKS